MVSTIQVTKSAIWEQVFRNFYSILDGHASFTNKIFPAFPENFDIDDKGDYPVCILNSAKLSEEQFTFGQSHVDGTIQFEIYTSDAKTCDEFSSDAKDQVETSKDTLATVGLRQVFLDDSDKIVVQRGKINVHNMNLVFRYRFYYNKTSAF
jgi:hypothetical protein